MTSLAGLCLARTIISQAISECAKSPEVSPSDIIAALEMEKARCMGITEEGMDFLPVTYAS